jgi:hypothetical protein
VRTAKNKNATFRRIKPNVPRFGADMIRFERISGRL